MTRRNPDVKAPSAEKGKEGWHMKLMLNMKCDLGESGAICIYYVKCFPLQTHFSSAFFYIRKIRGTTLGISLGL
jgi:hypothetical protein